MKSNADKIIRKIINESLMGLGASDEQREKMGKSPDPFTSAQNFISREDRDYVILGVQRIWESLREEGYEISDVKRVINGIITDTLG